MPKLPKIIRGLVPALPRSVWTLELGVVVNSFGSGMAMPFGALYLHDTRGISLGTTGLALATFAAVSFAVTPFAGSAADRIGPKPALVSSLLVLALGYGLLPLVRHPWEAFACLGIAGVGNGGFWPSQSTVLAGLAGKELRAEAYAVQRLAFNFGLGIGGLAAGLIASTTHPRTFTIIFVADALTFVAYAALLAAVKGIGVPAPQAASGAGAPWGRVLRDRTILAVVALNVVYVVCGYSLFEVGLPLYAKNDAGVSEREIGALFLVDTVVIVIAQLPVAKLLAGRRRLRVLALMALLWGAAWLLVAAGGHWSSGAGAAAAFGVAVAAFGLGECALGPMQSALVADLAPDELRGRYLSLLTNSYAVGFTVGPALVTRVIHASPMALWIGAAVGLAAAAWGGVFVERMVPIEARTSSPAAG